MPFSKSHPQTRSTYTNIQRYETWLRSSIQNVEICGVNEMECIKINEDEMNIVGIIAIEVVISKIARYYYDNQTVITRSYNQSESGVILKLLCKVS